MQIIFRKGLPTKKSMRELIESHFGTHHYKIHIHTYVPGYMVLIWSSISINGKMGEFKQLLKDNGVEVYRFNLYDSPMNGSLSIEAVNSMESL